MSDLKNEFITIKELLISIDNYIEIKNQYKVGKEKELLPLMITTNIKVKKCFIYFNKNANNSAYLNKIMQCTIKYDKAYRYQSIEMIVLSLLELVLFIVSQEKGSESISTEMIKLKYNVKNIEFIENKYQEFEEFYKAEVAK